MYVRAAMKYWGGKYYYLKHIIPHLTGDCVVDVFGGSGVVIQNCTNPCRHYNDIDTELVEWFRWLKENLLDYSDYLYGREEWETWKDTDPFIRNQQSFAGLGDGWSRDLKERARGAKGFRKACDSLEKLFELWQGISIHNHSWEHFFNSSSTLYLDPPYLCDSGKRYRHTMSVRDHANLMCAIKEYTGKVVLSGYANPLYESVDWDERITFKGIENTQQGSVEEVLWIKHDKR